MRVVEDLQSHFMRKDSKIYFEISDIPESLHINIEIPDQPACSALAGVTKLNAAETLHPPSSAPRA